jgi:DNA modification methylase
MDTIELNKIYCENCLDTMARMDDGLVDLVITSPPYDNLRDYKGYKFDFNSISRELYRIIAAGGVCVWIVNDQTINGSETGTSFRQSLEFIDVGFRLHDTMIWNKNATRYPDTTRYYSSFEYMFVLSKGRPKTINLLRDRANIHAGGKIARSAQIRSRDGKLLPNSAFRNHPNKRLEKFGVRFNVWTMPAYIDRSRKYLSKCPAIFPLELIIDHMLTWSKDGDIIYDPMIGSGTVAEAAILLDRYYIGTEIAREYCEIAERRISEVS